MSNDTTQQVTIPEAIGFWQKNKSWLIPALTALAGILGGANSDKVGALIPSSSDTVAVVKRVDALENRMNVVEAKLSPQGSSVIKVE